MAMLSVLSCDKTSAENLEEQWRSKIKYFKKQALEDIDLEEYIVHFKANGELLNKRKRSASSTVRQSAVPAGRRPVWGALEIRLTEWIKEMHGLRKQVIRVLVIKKALGFEPNFSWAGY